MGDPLHETSITQECVGIVIDNRKFRFIELCCQDLLCSGHTDSVRKTLSKGTGGGLDTGGDRVLRVTGGLRVKLPEILELLKWQLIPAQVQQRIDKHGSVTVGQYESIPVR